MLSGSWKVINFKVIFLVKIFILFSLPIICIFFFVIKKNWVLSIRWHRFLTIIVVKNEGKLANLLTVRCQEKYKLFKGCGVDAKKSTEKEKMWKFCEIGVKSNLSFLIFSFFILNYMNCNKNSKTLNTKVINQIFLNLLPSSNTIKTILVCISFYPA